MPSVSKFSRAAQESSLGKMVDQALSLQDGAGSALAMNELDFIESPQGLNMQLYPVQRVIVKALLGVPIDYKENQVEIFDVMHAEKTPLRVFSETEYLRWKFEEGKGNVADWRDIPEGGFGTAALYAGRRGGKMLSVDEVIPTPDGFKRNGDLVAGDTVFGEGGKTHTVTHAHPIEQVEAFKVSFDDGTFTYAHAGHLWRTYTHKERKNLRQRKGVAPVQSPGTCGCGCGQTTKQDATFVRYHHHKVRRSPVAIDGGVRTTKEIAASLKADTRRHETNHAIPLSAPVHLPERDLPIDPYCLGYWLGDGSSSCGVVTCCPEDAVFVGPHFEAAGLTFDLMDSSPMAYSVRGIHKPLRLLGLLRDKHIPHAFLWASFGQRLALLQGLMDSDGHAQKGRSRVEFCNTKENLARGVYHLAASLGLKPHWNEGRARLYGKDCGPKFIVTWSANLPVFRLPRKLAEQRAPNRPWTSWRYITAIEPAGPMAMRCITTDNPTHLYLFGHNFNVTHNSEVVAAIGAVMLRRLLLIRDPQAAYQIMEGSFIDFTMIGTDEESATRLYAKFRAQIGKTSFFHPYLKSNTESEMTFLSEADRERPGVVSSIRAAAWPCTTNAVRGPSSYFLALDEFAFFRSSKNTNSDDLYKAATPATSNFKSLRDPDEADSKIVCISSPGARLGKMYELHRLALDLGINSGIFTLNCYTAEMNPGLPAKKLHQDKLENPDTFDVEFGGKFLEGAGSYVPPQQFDLCVDDRPNVTRFLPSAVGRKYFWGFDLGMKNDASALAIGHLTLTEGKGIELIIDYVDRMMVGEQFEGPGVPDAVAALKYVYDKELRIDDIIKWLVYMHQCMPCFRGVTDQGGGVQLKQNLQLNGITEMELVHITPQINSQTFSTLRGYVSHGTVRFPKVDKFIREFKLLEAEYVNKYQLRVAAPNEKGAHDDMADAVALVAWQAQKWLDEDGNLASDPSARILLGDNFAANPAPVLYPGAVSVRDLRVIQRLQQMTRNQQMPPGANPNRGGRRGR